MTTFYDKWLAEGERVQEKLRIQFGVRLWFTDIWPEGYLPQRVYDDSGRPIVAGRIAS